MGSYPSGDFSGIGSDFWGTTQNGGADGNGTVFKLNRTTGVLTTVVEFTFNGASNKGSQPQTALRLDASGNFWGTTQYGGASYSGTVFKLDSTTGVLTTVIEFTGNTLTNKGRTPQAGFSADSAGNLWSSTSYGGASDRGTLFKLNPTTGVLTTVIEFPGGDFTKGTSPAAGLTPDGAGFLWGSTATGGTNGLGTLFKISAPAAPSLTTSVLTTVVHFTGNGASNKGSAPQATLRPDGAGNLWGTTLTGGANGFGTVFKINTSSAVLTTVVEFTGNAATNKGSQPRSELLDDGSGSFWGTTSLGGAGDHGTVFKIDAALGLLTTVAEFTGTGGAKTGRTPCGGLGSDGSGYLWGTTASGGTGGFGTVYKIHAISGAFTSVLEFTGNGANNKGAAPRSRLTPDGAGYLWGTTEDGALGDGTVFKILVGTGQLTTVVQFTGNGPTNRGSHPLAMLTNDGGGRLWGTTRSGGTNGQGSVFSILISTGVLTTELDLTGNGPQANSGSSPGPGAFYFHSDGRLYGTTSDGGPFHDGTVFRLHFEGAPEIVVQGRDGSPLTDNVGPTAIGPVRLKTPFIATITIRNDGYFPLSVPSITISRDGSATGPISLKDVRSYDSQGNSRWSQFGQLPPTIAPGERVDVSFEIPPSQPGPHSFTIHISSDDSDENPFEIHLTANFTFQKDLLVAQPNTHNVLRFDGITGEPKGTFIAAGAGGLDAPAQMIVGPDEKLYIADSVANVVKRFDLDGNFIDNFTPVGTLTNPVALKFGPDGKLYVLCGGVNRQIHRFHGTTGVHEALLVNATSIQLNSAKDFIFMPSTNDFLVTSATNAVARFNFTTGSFVSNYLNSSKNISVLNSPTGITIGPDGNYWLASSNGTNKITRFNIINGARINDAFTGGSLTGGHQEIKYENGFLYVANGSANSITIYDAFHYVPPVFDPDYIPSSVSGSVFVPQGSQGPANPKNLLFLDFNGPPSANAGADQSASPGQVVTLAGAGGDPEVLPLSYQWTQLSGTPVLSGSLLASGDVNSASLGFINPDSGGPLVFQLTVSDGVKSATDTVVVTISGPPVGVVPVLTLQAADGLTTQGAILHGTVNPVAGSAACRFEYGPVSLDTWTAVQTVNSAQAVSATLTGLLPGQTYFYRLIATNGSGGQFSTERSFTTLFEHREIIVESPPSPALTDGSGELDLSKVIHGRSGIARIITIRNGGATDLLLGPITKDGTDLGDFAVSTPATTVLSAGTSVNFTVIFTPGALGIRTASIHILSNDADEASFDIALTGTGVTPPEAWRFQNFGTITNTGNAADSFDPDHDGLLNLLERAFNLNPNQPALPILTPGTGTTGLPLIRRTGQPPVFSIQYLRRKASSNSGLTYSPQFSSSLTASGPDGWATAAGTETVQSIDSEWERVTVEEDASTNDKRFGRVKVSSGE